MATIEATVCEYCGEGLTPEEIQYPEQEGLICCDCYHEHFEFSCFWCDNYEHEDFQDKILVIAEECGGLPVGVYEILRLPYFTSNYFDMWWNKECLQKVRDLPADWPTENDYESGHLCRDCQKKIMTAPTGWIGQRLN